MRLDTLTYSAMRWLVAAAAAGAFVVTLSVQTVRGDSVAAPAAASVETAITSDSTPAVPSAGKLVAVSLPGLRAPVRHKARHRAAPAPKAVTELVAAPAVTPTPAPVPTAAPPVAAAPPPAPARPAPKPPSPAHGPGFDSSG
jgi:hypothetical protein